MVKKHGPGIPASQSEQEKIDGSIKDIILFEGDSIQIKVYQHDEFTQALTIPPGGRFYYPIVGYINANGMSLKVLRNLIVQGLERKRKYLIGPGDGLSITVYNHDDLNKNFVVPPEGYFYYPLIGEVQAEGKTLRVIRSEITAKLADYVKDPNVMIDINTKANPTRIVDPQVSILVTSLGSRKVFVLGQVTTPGIYIISGNTTLLESIVSAGGLSLDSESRNVLLIRGGLQNPELHVYSIKAIIQKGDMTQNPVLEKGDIIYVPISIIANVANYFGYLSKMLGVVTKAGSSYIMGMKITSTDSGNVGVSISAQ